MTDIVANLMLDASGVRDGAAEAVKAYREVDVAGQMAQQHIAEQTTKSIVIQEQQIRVIHEQRGSLIELANTSLHTFGVVLPIAYKAGQAYGLVAKETSLMGHAWHATSMLARPAISLLGGSITQMAGASAPALGTVSVGLATVAATAGLAYAGVKAFTSDLADEMHAATIQTEELRTSGFGKLRSEIGNLAGEIASPFVDGAQSIAGFIRSMDPITPTLRKIASAASDWATSQAANLKNLTERFVAYKDNLVGVAIAIREGGGAQREDEIAQETRSLRDQASATSANISKLEQQREAARNLSAIQDQAAESARRAADIQRVSSMTSLEQLQAERVALQQKLYLLQATDPAKYKSEVEASAAMFGAIEKQEAGIKAGSIKSPTEIMIENTQKQLDLLNTSQEYQAIVTARANGATDEQIAKLEELQAGIREVTQANKEWESEQQAQKKIAEDLARAESEAKRQMERDFEAQMQEKKRREDEQTAELAKPRGPVAALMSGSFEAFSSIFAAQRNEDARRQLTAAETAANLLKSINEKMSAGGMPSIEFAGVELS